MTTSEQPGPALAEHPGEIAGFTVTRLLGRGGSATVWAARGGDAQAREVAIKLYEDHDQRHQREREALRLVGPGVAPAVLAHGRHGARPYLVMEQVRGPTLVEIIAACPPPAIVAGHVAALARALDAIHAAGVVHRDLKPGHVFLAGDSVTVIDFGLACFPDARRDRDGGQHPGTLELTREDERIGTPWYMAPEQCRGEAGDARTDIYALGIIAFELLTGRRPFDGDAATVRAAQVSHRPPAASSWAALPAAVDAVLRRCLAKEQSLRYQRAGELADELARAVAGHLPENPLALSASPSAPAAPAVSAGPAARTARIALLSVPFPGSTLALTHALEPGEHVVRVTGPRYLIAVHEPTAPAAGVHAAVRAAARLGARLSLPVEAAIVVHSAVVRLRQTARGLQVRGPDLDLPALAPPPAITGLVLTRAAAGALAPGASQPLDQDYAVLRAGAEAATLAVALAGRDHVLAELTDGRGAGDICTIIGDVGLGKTRLLSELAVRLRADGDQVVALDAGAGEPLLGQLIGACTGSCTGSFGHLAGAVRASLVTGDQREVLEAALGVEGVEARGAVPARGLHARAAEAAAALVTGLAARAGQVSVLVDDAHHADPVVLDALEQAVARSRSVWVCAAGLPALAASRPGWVADAPGRRCVELTPLALDDARTLLRALMAPAEFIPEAVIDRLADAAAGVPLYLVEQVHALRTGGSMRAHAATADLFVAADELAHVSTTPLARRLAGSLLAPLSPILRRCAALAAVCGDLVGAGELDDLQRALGGDWLDAGVALARLAEAGLLAADGGDRYRFRHALLRQAIEAGAPAEVAAWHRAALALLPAPENADLPTLHRIARHARACSDRDMAWSAWFALAEHARARHAYVEAEQHYSIALEQIAPEAHGHAPEAARRRRTLAGRGHARYRIQRFTDALDDIRAARACAEAAGDTGPLVRLLLEEATLLDWIYDIEASTACARRARALAADAAPVDAGLDSRSLPARLLAAEGRSAYRHEQFPEAIDLLGRAAAEAVADADDEARVIALLLLAPSLLYADRLAEAETCYAEVVGLCEQIGDTFHLAAAHTNRQFLWMRLGRMDRAEADLTRAIQLARTLGNALVERIASHNLGELLYWSGRAGEALTHARRSAHLQRRFPDAHHVPDDSLLVARVLVALARMDEARALLAEVLRRWPVADMTPTAQMLVELLTLQLEAAPEARWRAAAARHLAGIDVVDFALELHHAAATAALARGAVDEARAWLATAVALGHRSPSWSARLDALAARLGASP
jgi:tetratricopeptide (TPR) repeat protein